MTPEEVLAREQIRDTIARYAHSVDEERWNDLADLFTGDGTLEIHRFGQRHVLTGADAITQFLSRGAAERRRTPSMAQRRHHVASTVIELERSNTASSCSYFIEVMHAHGPNKWGRYHDRLVLDAGTWRFAHRRVEVDGSIPEARPA
jgi:hypothetical protein